MTKTEFRHRSLTEFLTVHGFATVEDLARHFEVTPQTMRKDINALAEEGVVQRFHGGAGISLSTRNIIYDRRKNILIEEKRRISAMVAAHIPDDASILINIGTTMEEVASALLEHHALRVVTTSLNVASILARNESFDIQVVSGTVRHQDKGVVGPAAAECVARYRPDFGITSVAGIGEDGSLLEYDAREVPVQREILRNARHAFVATDSSKFGRAALHRITGLGDVEAVFTNAPVQERWLRLCRSAGAECFLS